MYEPEDWPIAAKMNFPNKLADGTHINDASPLVWEEDIKQIVDQGFRWIDPVDDWVQIADLSDERFAEFQDLLAKYKLQVWGVSCGRRSPVDSQNGPEYVEMMHRMIDRAKALGAQVVNIGFMQELTDEQKAATWFWLVDGHKDNPHNRDLAIARVRELADHASQLGMEISLEMYEDTFIGTAEDAVQFIKDCDHSAVGLNPDIGNFIRLHRPMPHWKTMFDQVLPYINYWHIKNYQRDEDPATGSYSTFPTSLEDGFIDYRTVIRDALSVGYTGAFQTEHYGGDWLSMGARNAKYIRSILRGARSNISQDVDHE